MSSRDSINSNVLAVFRLPDEAPSFHAKLQNDLHLVYPMQRIITTHFTLKVPVYIFFIRCICSFADMQIA